MKRFIAIILVAFTILATFVIIRNITRQNSWEANREVITIKVQSGDTIDGFWVEYAPNWISREQYRAEIMELNNMNSCTLHIGQTLKLYTEK